MHRPAVIALLLAAPAPAFALDQSVHRSISHDACRAAQLPQDFCERVGTEAYNVDSYEWGHVEAHAQIADTGPNSTACTAANAALERERTLGSDIRTGLVELAWAPSENLRIQIATDLGRALHTIQDECAHRGMPNVQHAWWSLMDTCTGSKTSPDLQPEAATCARSETAAVFAAFTQQMATAGIAPATLDDVPEGWAHWPARGGVCAFLYGAARWDGVDRRWNNDVVVPWLRDQLTNAITNDDSSIGDACAAGVVLAAENPDVPFDVSRPTPVCAKVRALCIGTGGKADSEEVPPPWEDQDAAAQASGCSVGSTAPAGWLVLSLAALALSSASRRRGRPRGRRMRPGVLER